MENFKHFKMHWLLVLFFLSLVFNGQAETKYMKYKDPKQPLNTRIHDLMSRMTLAEKIGQMTQIERLNATANVMQKYFIGKKYFYILYTNTIII